MKEKERKKEKDWQKINAKYKRISFRLNKKEEPMFNLLFKKSNEKYEGTFVKKCVFFGGSDYKESEELNKKVIESNLEIKTQLKKIGANINQITIKLNLLQEFSNDDKKEILKEIGELKLLIYNKILR